MDPLHIFLASVIVMLLLLLFLSVGWIILREFHYRSIVEVHDRKQEAYASSLQEMSKDITVILAEVTHTMKAAMKSIDGTTAVSNKTYMELIKAFSDCESRIMDWLLKLQTGERVHNHITNMSGDSKADQIAGEIKNEKRN
jgi:glutaredoxin 2